MWGTKGASHKHAINEPVLKNESTSDRGTRWPGYLRTQWSGVNCPAGYFWKRGPKYLHIQAPVKRAANENLRVASPGQHSRRPEISMTTLPECGLRSRVKNWALQTCLLSRIESRPKDSPSLTASASSSQGLKRKTLTSRKSSGIPSRFTRRGSLGWFLATFDSDSKSQTAASKVSNICISLCFEIVYNTLE